MFNNIGEKIKKLSATLAIIGIIFSVTIGIFIGVLGGNSIGVLIAIAGSFISWISSFFSYGFGELVSNSTKIRCTICNEDYSKNANSDNEVAKINIFTDEEKEKIYKKATTLMLSGNENDILEAVELLSDIKDYKNSAPLINDLNSKLKNLK